MKPGDICQLLDWDSAFFGIGIARLIPSRVASSELHEALNWCECTGVKCLYFLADSDHAESVQLAEASGFNLVDIRITLDCDLGETSLVAPRRPTGFSIRTWALGDLARLRAIAGSIYRDTRFYHDPRFPKELVDALYMTWIEKSCEGCADEVLVLERDRQPMGYVACHASRTEVGRIGLIGVDQGVQGLGAGQYLVHSALQWFANHGVGRVEVVTQGRNCEGQRLYQRCGFVTRKVQLWYHKWLRA